LVTSRVYCPWTSLDCPTILNKPSLRAVTPAGKFVEPSFDHVIVAPLEP